MNWVKKKLGPNISSIFSLNWILPWKDAQKLEMEVLQSKCCLNEVPPAIWTVFSCPGSSIPDLSQWVSGWLTHCHFRILTQRLTFETWDPSYIWSERCPDKKTKRQKKDEKRKRPKTKKRVLNYCNTIVILFSTGWWTGLDLNLLPPRSRLQIYWLIALSTFMVIFS